MSENTSLVGSSSAEAAILEVKEQPLQSARRLRGVEEGNCREAIEGGVEGKATCKSSAGGSPSLQSGDRGKEGTTAEWQRMSAKQWSLHCYRSPCSRTSTPLRNAFLEEYFIQKLVQLIMLNIPASIMVLLDLYQKNSSLQRRFPSFFC